MVLDVPYRSQLGKGAEWGIGDCGAACLAMVAAHYGHAATVDEASHAMAKARGYRLATFADLQRGAKRLGFTARWQGRVSRAAVEQRLAAGQPVIVLVWYPFLPTRFDTAYQNGHFIVVVGMEGDEVIYHDPYYRGTIGTFCRMSWDDFARAWNQTGIHAKTPRQALVMG